MIRIAFAAAAAAALLAAAPAWAERTPVEAANAAATAEAGTPAAVASERDKGERKICKTFEYSASRLKREKLCLTRDEWKKFEADQM
jgi:invasion protein IalB